MAAHSNPIARPTVAISFMARLLKIGERAFQAELDLTDAEWVDAVKSHAMAIFCFENGKVAQALGYQTYCGEAGGPWGASQPLPAGPCDDELTTMAFA